MNEYVVGVIISANGKIVTSQLIKAKDKPQAIKKAIAMCIAEGLETYGTSYCDYC